MSPKTCAGVGGNLGGLTAALAVRHELHGDVDVTGASASERFPGPIARHEYRIREAPLVEGPAMTNPPEHTCSSICPAPRTRNRMPIITGRLLRRKARRRSAPSLTAADDDSFAASVASPLPVVVYLSTPWCEPCRSLGLTVEQAAGEFAGRLKVVTVNVDDAPAAVQRLGVQVVPTLVVLHHGRELARSVGALPPAALNNWLGAVLQTAA